MVNKLTPTRILDALKACPWLWPVAAWAVACVGYLAEFYIFRSQVLTDAGSFVGLVTKGAFDAALIFIFFWWAGPRWRWPVLLVPVWIVPVWMLANVLYFRQFDTVLPFASLRFTENLAGGTVARATLGLVRDGDWLFFAIPAAVTLALALLLRRRMKGVRLPRTVKLTGTALCLVLVLVGQLRMFMFVREDVICNRGEYASVGDVLSEQYVRFVGVNMALYQRGFAVYCLTEGLKELFSSRGAIELDHKEIDAIEALRRERLARWAVPDPALAANRGKNLVVVIVESLNSWAITPELTPVLDSLVNAPGTVSALNLVSQVSHGESSDGQLMISTGLLPMRDGAVSMLFPYHAYPSLAAELRPASANEVNCVSRGTWHHAAMADNWAFDSLHCDRSVAQRLGRPILSQSVDSAVVVYGLQLLDSVRRPAFVQLLTLSMHTPFVTAEVPAGVLRPHNASSRMERYKALTAKMDAQIGHLLEGLRIRGLLDNTVVVIASDHDTPVVETDGTGPASSPVAFIAANTGITRRITRVGGQVDIFPTILQIMGVDHPSWPGVGHSLLDPSAPAAAIDAHGTLTGPDSLRAPLEEAWQVSRLAIQGNFFGRRQQK